MSKDSLYRLSGGALFFGALLSAVGYLLKPVVGHDIGFYFNPLYLPSSLLTFIGAVFMLMGLPGIFLWTGLREKGQARALSALPE